MYAEVRQIILMLQARTWHAVGQPPVSRHRLKAGGRPFFENVPQECQARRALTMQHAATRPPEDVLRMQERIAVSDVAAVNRTLPEPAHHLLGSDVAPAVGDIAFVAAFVDHHRLAVLLAPLGDARQIRMLDALVSDPAL